MRIRNDLGQHGQEEYKVSESFPIFYRQFMKILQNSQL